LELGRSLELGARRSLEIGGWKEFGTWSQKEFGDWSLEGVWNLEPERVWRLELGRSLELGARRSLEIGAWSLELPLVHMGASLGWLFNQIVCVCVCVCGSSRQPTCNGLIPRGGGEEEFVFNESIDRRENSCLAQSLVRVGGLGFSLHGVEELKPAHVTEWDNLPLTVTFCQLLER
jgi:hypothetical protein